MNAELGTPPPQASLVAADRGRVVAVPNPAQEIAQEVPQLINESQLLALSQSIELEMAQLGFSSRQSREAINFLEAYSLQTREYHEAAKELGNEEKNGQGFGARANRFVDECRKLGVMVKRPKILTASTLEKTYITALKKAKVITKKLTGGFFALFVAVVIKSYLLLPLASSLMSAVMGTGESPTKTILAIMLAASLSYGITFMARFIVMLLVGAAGSDESKEYRTSGRIFDANLTRGMLWLMVILFALTMGAFVMLDFAHMKEMDTLPNPGSAVLGLSTLFVGTVVAYEVFVAYRTFRFQKEPEKQMVDRLTEMYQKAIERYQDEVDLARMRTLTLQSQDVWHAFLGNLDSGTLDGPKAARSRAQVMAALRAQSTQFRRFGKSPKRGPYMN